MTRSCVDCGNVLYHVIWEVPLCESRERDCVSSGGCVLEVYSEVLREER